MSADGQRTKCRRNIVENFDRLSRVHERYRQTNDRQTNGRQHSERGREFTFAKIVMWFGVIIGRSRGSKSRANSIERIRMSIFYPIMHRLGI